MAKHYEFLKGRFGKLHTRDMWRWGPVDTCRYNVDAMHPKDLCPRCGEFVRVHPYTM